MCVLVWHVKYAEHKYWPDCLRGIFDALYGHSDVMDEARKRGGICDRVLRTVKPAPGDKPTADGEVRGPWTDRKNSGKDQAVCGAACVLWKEADVGYRARGITFVDNASREYATTIYLSSSSALGGSVKLVISNNKPRLLRLYVQRKSQYSSLLTLFVPLIFDCISLLVVSLMMRFRKGIESIKVQPQIRNFLAGDWHVVWVT